MRLRHHNVDCVGAAMLNIWTTTWSRPDLVQLLADAVRATAAAPYTLRVVVQPGGLQRNWRHVDEVIVGPKADSAAWLHTVRMAGDGDHLHLHDDCVPLNAWTLPAMPFGRSVGGGAVGSTIIGWNGRWRNIRGNIPAPRARPDTMPDWWPETLRTLAEQGQCEVLLGGDFLHLDKGTCHHPASPYNSKKPAIIKAICQHLGIETPEPLTAAELSFQQGWIPPNVARLPDEDGGAKVSLPGLGDLVKAGLSAVGITEERVSRAIGRPCGCSKRAAALNKLGTYLGLPPGSTASG